MRVFELPAFADLAGKAGTIQRNHPLQVVLRPPIDQKVREPRSARRVERDWRPELLDHSNLFRLFPDHRQMPPRGFLQRLARGLVFVPRCLFRARLQRGVELAVSLPSMNAEPRLAKVRSRINRHGSSAVSVLTAVEETT